METTKDTPFVSRASLLARSLARKRGMLAKERWPRDRIEAEQRQLLAPSIEREPGGKLKLVRVCN